MMFFKKDSRIPYSMVVGLDEKTNGIGFEGMIPWKCSPDMKHFKKFTTTKDAPDQQVVLICGSKTFESFNYNNLPGRHTIVVSRGQNVGAADILYGNDVTHKRFCANWQMTIQEKIIMARDENGFYSIGVKGIKNLPKAIEAFKRYCNSESKTDPKLIVIGGGEIYKLFLENKFLIDNFRLTKAVITLIDLEKGGFYKATMGGKKFDRFFPMDQFISFIQNQPTSRNYVISKFTKDIAEGAKVMNFDLKFYSKFLWFRKFYK